MAVVILIAVVVGAMRQAPRMQQLSKNEGFAAECRREAHRLDLVGKATAASVQRSKAEEYDQLARRRPIEILLHGIAGGVAIIAAVILGAPPEVKRRVNRVPDPDDIHAGS
jgi:hypothetical protein